MTRDDVSLSVAHCHLLAFDSASKEVQEADHLLTLAAAEVKRINEIPKNKAGGGKGKYQPFLVLIADDHEGAKAKASKQLREAKLRKKEKMDQLEVVKNLLLDNKSEDLSEVSLFCHFLFTSI